MITQDSAQRFVFAIQDYQEAWAKAAQGFDKACNDLTRKVHDDQADRTNYFFLKMARAALLRSSQQLSSITENFYNYANSIRTIRVASIEPLMVVIDAPTLPPPQAIANYDLAAAREWETFSANILLERQTIERAMDTFRSTYLSLRSNLQDGTLLMQEIDSALRSHWSDVRDFLKSVEVASSMAKTEAHEIERRYL